MSFTAGPGGFKVYRYAPGEPGADARGYLTLPGALMRIAADPSSPAIAGVNVKGEIWRSDKGDGSDWTQLPGAGVDVVFGSRGQLYVVGTDPA